MSREQDLIDYLNDIIIAITDIEDFTYGMSFELFAGDKIESYASVQKDKIADWELASNGELPYSIEPLK